MEFAFFGASTSVGALFIFLEEEGYFVLKKHHIILLCSLGVLLIAIIVRLCISFSSKPTTSTVEPTCTENGYTVYTYKDRTEIKDIVPALGHKFDEWNIVSEPMETVPGTRNHTCTVCGTNEEERYYSERSTARLLLYGSLDGIGKKSQVDLSAILEYDDLSFSGIAKLKHQGHSSLEFDKKNFTIKFYDEQDEKVYFEFSDWNSETKYVLKANYTDTSRSRNLISADIWSQIVSTRDTLHPRLEETSNLGAVDGFPIEVYHNDTFIGIYNLTLHKDDGLFGMKENSKDGIIISNGNLTASTLFKECVDWEGDEEWEIEYSGLEDSTWIKTKTNEFISFVINSSDEEFKNNLKNYADVDSLIDYLIAIYALGLNEHYYHDVLFATYDNGPFIASLFDMESAFGLSEEEKSFASASLGLPTVNGAEYSSGTDSLLWNRLISLFSEEITKRYMVLRDSVLSIENVNAIIVARCASIPESLNSADLLLYPDQPLKDTDHKEQMQSYFSERISLLDNIFGYKGELK